MKKDCRLVSIVIATRNRWNDLQKAIDSCLSQDYNNLEILVYDDASEDNQINFFKTKYPNVKFFRSIKNVGYINLRNNGFAKAKGDFVFSLDDDAFFVEKETIAEAVKAFIKYPKMGVATMPFKEPKDNQYSIESLLNESIEETIPALVASYCGAVHAVRRVAILEVGGYREFFFHQGEEVDLSVRLMEKGWKIIRINTPASIHCPSPVRDWTRLHVFGPRNAILFNFLNAPFPFVIPRLIINTIGVLWHGWRIGEMWLKIVGVANGYGACVKYFAERKPVSIKTWRRFCSLLKNPEPLEV